jgi:hypothetical protein
MPQDSLPKTRRAFAILALLFVTLSCNASPVGPTLAGVDVTPPTIRASGGDNVLCCCRVVGTAVTNNRVAVHVTINYKAFDGVQQDPLAT